MVSIQPGTIRMGDIRGTGKPNERPVHEVRFSKPFAIARYPVTFAEYDQFVLSTGQESPDDEGWGRGDRPVVNVSWNDAVAYADWLSAREDRPYRLPTEAEWEYAARAGSESEFWWGDEPVPGMANCRELDPKWGGDRTSPVGSFPANPWGLHDTAGNVWEWVQDCWHPSYDGAPTDGSAWVANGDEDCAERVLRGGCWFARPPRVRSAIRDNYFAHGRYHNVQGFRLASDV